MVAKSLRGWFRRILWVTAAVVATASGFVAVVLFMNKDAFGGSASGARLNRMEASPQWHEGAFRNPQPLWNNTSLVDNVRTFWNASDFASPEDPQRDIPVVRTSKSQLAQAPNSGLRVTWFGHSSVLIELDGLKVLTDPVWGERTSPVPWLGPKRWYAPPLPLDELPAIDAVVISHDHYDHLDYTTFAQIKDWDTTFFVPLGVAAHLVSWGVPESRIVELDWWDDHQLGPLRLVCTPARHASGRSPFDQNATLWSGWALLGPQHRVYFSGDTGLFDGLRDIGNQLGPFDLTMVEVGAYNQNWPDWHSGPEQAVLAHQWLKGKLFMPIHWGLFNLSTHGWTEPVERVRVASQTAGIRSVAPRPGQIFEINDPPPLAQWWPSVPWQTAKAYPIESGDANGRPPRR